MKADRFLSEREDLLRDDNKLKGYTKRMKNSSSLLGQCEALTKSTFFTGAILGLLCFIPYLSNTFGISGHMEK